MLFINGRYLNEILTDEEYIEQGFTAKECPLIRRHDYLYNQMVIWGKLKPRKYAEMMEIIERLGL